MRHIWSKFINFWRNNFLILGVILLLAWFLFVWLRFKDEPTYLVAYAAFGTAVGTVALALATFLMVRSTRKMAQESVYERGQARATEFVAVVVDPLIDRLRQVGEEVKKRSFSWSEYPLEQRADRVLKHEDLDKFEIVNQEVTRYFIPYAHIEILSEEGVNLYAMGFEFRRKHELDEKYRDLSKEISAYDKQVHQFHHVLGNIAICIHSLLTDLEPFSKLEKEARPYVVGIAFREMAWPPNIFEGFLPQYATNEKSASARDFYTRNRGLIQSTLFPRLSEARQELDLVCDDLQKRLSSIGSMLEDIRSKLCEQYLISETAIRQIRKSRSVSSVEHY